MSQVTSPLRDVNSAIDAISLLAENLVPQQFNAHCVSILNSLQAMRSTGNTSKKSGSLREGGTSKEQGETMDRLRSWYNDCKRQLKQTPEARPLGLDAVCLTILAELVRRSMNLGNFQLIRPLLESTPADLLSSAFAASYVLAELTFLIGKLNLLQHNLFDADQKLSDAACAVYGTPLFHRVYNWYAVPCRLCRGQLPKRTLVDSNLWVKTIKSIKSGHVAKFNQLSSSHPVLSQPMMSVVRQRLVLVTLFFMIYRLHRLNPEGRVITWKVLNDALAAAFQSRRDHPTPLNLLDCISLMIESRMLNAYISHKDEALVLVTKTPFELPPWTSASAM